MTRTTPMRLLVPLIVVVTALAGCGDGRPTSGLTSGPTSGPTSASTPAPTSDAGADPDGGEPGDPDLRDVTVVLDWTPNTNHSGMYVAQQHGWYRDAGLDVEIIQPGQQGALQVLASGEADVGVSVAEALVPARAQGVPVVSLAAIVATNTSSLMSLPQDDVASPADLEGLRYGGFGGELEQALVDRLVACDGGDPARVEFVEVGNVDYRVGLERDHYDVVWIFDAWDGVRLDLAGTDHDRIPFRDHGDCIPNWYTPLLASNEAMVADDPDVLADFLAATARGYRVAIDDPSAAADALLAGAPELDAEMVHASAAWLAPWYAEGARPWGHQEGDVWTAFTDFLVDAGMLDEPIDVDAAFTNRFLPDVD